jgi:hypothetical protein
LHYRRTPVVRCPGPDAGCLCDANSQRAVVDEYWYSEDLRLNMLAIHRDPRTGETTTTVTQVSRREPDPAIFEIPAGYKITRTGAAQR